MTLTHLADARTQGSPDPAQVITTTLNGVTFKAGRRTAAHLIATDEAARARGCQLRVIQPCYNTGVAASAGTHDGDGVLDLEVEGMAWEDGQRFLREQGWAAWFRYPPTFSNHLHAVSIGCPGPVGVYVPGQVADYYAHRSGLAGHVTDSTWHPDDIDTTVFDYPAWEDRMTPQDFDRIQAMLDAQRASIIRDLFAAVVDGGKTTFGQLCNRGVAAIKRLPK